jgi:hypothetical protein
MPDLTGWHRRKDDPVERMLEAVREDDRTTSVPDRIEETVMRAWDARTSRTPEPRRLTARTIWASAVAAAACMALAAALWFQRVDNNVTVVSTDTGPDPLHAIATTGVLLQDDPASLQLVRISVEPSVLVAYGYPLANPMDTQPVDVDVLIGLDGVARAIVPVDAGGIWSVQ